MRIADIGRLIAAILICQAAGGIGALAMGSSLSSWYTTLNKPSFNPPGWVFGPVWTTLYTLMGIAAWMVWNKGTNNPLVRTALIFFAVQLVLNAAWTFLFFGLKMPLAAFVEIIILWIMIIITTIYFFLISKTAGALLLPYIVWVSFASVLNFYLWWLNR